MIRLYFYKVYIYIGFYCVRGPNGHTGQESSLITAFGFDLATLATVVSAGMILLAPDPAKLKVKEYVHTCVYEFRNIKK